jgi:NADH:ubiquinone oxidoreductase subunit 2 (subunit N)
MKSLLQCDYLLGIGLLYKTVGTLNFSHIAMRLNDMGDNRTVTMISLNATRKINEIIVTVRLSPISFKRIAICEKFNVPTVYFPSRI